MYVCLKVFGAGKGIHDSTRLNQIKEIPKKCSHYRFQWHFVRVTACGQVSCCTVQDNMLFVANITLNVLWLIENQRRKQQKTKKKKNTPKKAFYGIRRDISTDNSHAWFYLHCIVYTDGIIYYRKNAKSGFKWAQIQYHEKKNTMRI